MVGPHLQSSDLLDGLHEAAEYAPSQTGSPGDRPSRTHYRSALALAAVLIVATVIGSRVNSVQWPVLLPFIPIVATVWSLSEFITAVLLFSQFVVTGRIAFAIYGSVFGTTSILTVYYLLLFPGVFGPSPLAGSVQSSVLLWLAWHAWLPLVSLGYVAGRRQFRIMRDDASGTRRVLFQGIASSLLLGCGIGLVAVLWSDKLPSFLVAGHFTNTFRIPAILISVLNGLAATTLLAGSRRRTVLELWVGLALLSETCETLLNAAQERYSAGWYIGKVETTITATVLLVALITEIVSLYRRTRASLENAEQLARLLKIDIAARAYAEDALRTSDELFQQVEEHVAVGLALIALDGTFIRLNPALSEITGYTKERLLLTTHRALTHPDDIEANDADFKLLLEGSASNRAAERRYIRSDGRTIWVYLSLALVRNALGTPLYFIAQSHDVSDRRQAEAALELAQGLSKTAVDAKARFLATMSHEIRTPMNGVIGMTELLALTSLDNEQQECVEVISKSSRSLLLILNDVLDYSKMEAGQFEVHHTDVDVRAEVKSVVALLESQFRSKNVTISADVHESIPTHLSGDPGRVHQILLNLAGNALKFTRAEGSVRIVVAPEPTGDDSIPIRFSVIDTGIGISSDVRDRLFMPFSQIDNSASREYGGTGLGLSICKGLAELLGGTIGVASTPGVGSSFWFVIPFRRGEAPMTHDVATIGPDTSIELAARRTERLLLVEDNSINTLVALKQFKRLGFDVTAVANGRQAVDVTRAQKFDAIFMDCHMPILDGFAATKEIRGRAGESDERIPIIAMTANAQIDDRHACLAAGMDDYISKPTALAELGAILERWLPVDKRAGQTL